MPISVFCLWNQSVSLMVTLTMRHRERYKRELNFSRFGYTSIISLVCMLEDAVRISRPVDTGNWLLSDARAAAREPRPRRYLPVSVARCASAAAVPVDVDDALPGIDFVSLHITLD